MSLALGTFFGAIISFLMVLPILFTKEYKFRLKIDLLDKHFISLLKVSVPLFFGGIVFRSAPVFERMIASGLPVGSISILGYSGQLITILSTIATSGIVISFFPLMSDAWKKDPTQFIQYFNKGIRSILILTIPISFAFVLFGDTFIKIILQRGAFTYENTLAVSKTFAFMTPAFIMLCLGGITSKVFYISRRTLELTIISTLELFTYLILSYFLSLRFGYLGIAIGTSIAYSIFSFVYFFYTTYFIFKRYNYKLFLVDIIKILFGALISFSICFLFFTFIKNYIHEYIAVGLSLLIAFTSYLFTLTKFKNSEIVILTQKIHKR